MRKKLTEANILIVGLARDCESVIQLDVERITEAFSVAKSVRWLVIESDSSDRTIETLKILSEKFLLSYISLGRLRDRLNKRTERLAECRNRYLEEIRYNDEYTLMDFVVVADLDGVNCKLRLEAVLSCWEMEDDWDACFANQSRPYYDIWALRHETWSPSDCWRVYEFLVANGSNHFKALDAAVYSKMIQIKKERKPIKVRSAFGGLGIYKRSVFEKAYYSGLSSHGCEVCEHVSFNAALDDEGYALYINPKLINSDWNDHNKNLRITAKVKARLRHYSLCLVTIFFSKEKIKRMFKREVS